jgi:uncharacterized RDD family membrane protein YckC
MARCRRATRGCAGAARRRIAAGESAGTRVAIGAGVQYALELRRLILAGSGLVFSSIAVLALGMPHPVAAEYGFKLDSVDAMNEFRAVYTGFWLALGALYFTAARRVELTVLSALGGGALLLQALGRALSLAIDGVPSARFVGALALEAIAGAIVLISLRVSAERR